MSERLKKKVGEEVYQAILKAGVKPEEVDLVEGWIPRARFNEVNDKVKGLEGKVTTYETQLGETKELLKNSTEYKTKYDDLDTRYKADLAAKDKEIVNTKKKFLGENQLVAAGVKSQNAKLLMGQIDWDKVSVEGDNLLGFNDYVESFKKDYSDLFAKESVKSTPSGLPGAKSTVDDPSGDIDWEAAVNNLMGNTK